jgi:type II secretory pathway component PulF
MFFNTLNNKRALYYHLWSTIKAGLTISEALLHCPAVSYKSKCVDWAKDIRTGKNTFSGILQQDKSFNSYDCYIIEMAEKTGNFVEVFENLYQFYDHKIQTQTKLLTKLAYPCFLIFMTGIFYNIPLIISNFSIKKLFVNLLWFYLPFILLGGFFVWGLPKLLSKDNFFARNLESVVFRTPFLGKFHLSGVLARFMFSLEMVFRSGIPISNGFELVLKTTNSPNFRIDLRKIIAISHQGLSCQVLLKELKWLDPLSYSMIVTGEVAGQIPESMRRIYELKVEENRVSTFALIGMISTLVLLTACILAAYQIISMYSAYIDQILKLQ